MDPSMPVWLVPTIGITNTIGRVVCGMVSSLPGVDALFINNMALTIGGIATILSGVSLSFGYQMCYASVFGLAMGKEECGHKYNLLLNKVQDSVSESVFRRFRKIAKNDC
jgi:hypothetical protein